MENINIKQPRKNINPNLKSNISSVNAVNGSDCFNTTLNNDYINSKGSNSIKTKQLDISDNKIFLSQNDSLNLHNPNKIYLNPASIAYNHSDQLLSFKNPIINNKNLKIKYIALFIGLLFSLLLIKYSFFFVIISLILIIYLIKNIKTTSNYINNKKIIFNNRNLICGNTIIFYSSINNISINENETIINYSNNKTLIIYKNLFNSVSRKQEKIILNQNKKYQQFIKNFKQYSLNDNPNITFLNNI